MEESKVHPSHQMKYSDWGDDRHCIMQCTTCGYSHCYVCPEGNGVDDDELKAECIGFDWTKGIYDSDSGRLIGRRCGTGWPKPAKKTTQTT